MGTAADIQRQHLIDPEICIRCNTCEETCPVHAITHDARNYVVDFAVCNGCNACIAPCPTGAIDNWRQVARAEAYTLDDQLGWDVLPAPRDVASNDAAAGVERWNRIIEKAGIPFRLRVPHKAFHRKIGPLSAAHVDPDGHVVDAGTWAKHEREWLPSAEDRAFVASLMGRVAEPGRYANWIAAPARGINNQPADFAYVRFG